MDELVEVVRPKVGLWRYVIEKLFCHHQNENIAKIELKDERREVMSIKLIQQCKLCGKTKSITV